MFYRYLLAPLAALLLMNAAHAASFDCTKTSYAVEKYICSDQTLSALDSKLSNIYKAALTAASPASQPALRREQRDWVRYTRNACDGVTCMRAAYEARIKQLAVNSQFIVNNVACWKTADNPCRSLVILRDTGARVVSFNESLKQSDENGEIVGCDKLIDLPVGTAHGNHSYGGICTLQVKGARRRVEICNDDMLGHFAMRPFNKALDEDLAVFTNDNCFGG